MAISAVERERLWTEKRRAQEEAWSRGHPGLAYSNGLLANGGKGTFLDPNGDPAEEGAFANQFARLSRDRELSAVTAAGVDAGNDPQAAGYARLNARMGAANASAHAFGDFRTARAAQRRQLMAQFMSQQMGMDQNTIAMQQQREAAKKAANAGLWGTFGQAAGTIGGAMAGG